MTERDVLDSIEEPLLARVVGLLREMGAPAYLVGGGVRDRLLPGSAPGYDLDFAVPGDSLQTARDIADALGGAFYPLDRQRGVGRVVLPPPPPNENDSRSGRARIIDVARFQGPNLEADLAGRDFTVNAMALEIGHDPPALIDPFGGQADLRAQRLRAVSDQAMVKDPVRGLRAVRLAAQLGFRVDPETRELIRAAAYRLPRVSAERIQEEFLKTLATPGVAGSLRQLDDLGLLGEFLPEVTALRGVAQSRPHRFDVYEHTLHVVAALEMYLPLKGAALHPDVPYPEQVAEHLAREVAGGQSRRTLLALATLLHDAGKPGTATVEQGGRIRFFNHERAGAEIAGDVLRRLRFSGEATRLTAAIVRHHLRPLQLAWERSTSRRAAHRFFRHAGEAGVEVALLSLADHRATYGPDADVEEYSVLLRVVDALLDAYFNRQASVVAPAPLLGGRDLMREFGLKEGPALGRLLDALREAQAVGEVDSRSEARRWVKRRIEEWELEEGDRRGDTWKSR